MCACLYMNNNKPMRHCLPSSDFIRSHMEFSHTHTKYWCVSYVLCPTTTAQIIIYAWNPYWFLAASKIACVTIKMPATTDEHSEPNKTKKKWIKHATPARLKGYTNGGQEYHHQSRLLLLLLWIRCNILVVSSLTMRSARYYCIRYSFCVLLSLAINNSPGFCFFFPRASACCSAANLLCTQHTAFGLDGVCVCEWARSWIMHIAHWIIKEYFWSSEWNGFRMNLDADDIDETNTTTATPTRIRTSAQRNLVRLMRAAPIRSKT